MPERPKWRPMLPFTLQFLIAMIASAINERLQRKLDYAQEEVRGSQRDPLRRHGQRAYFLHRRSASSPGACGHKAEPRGATEVLPHHQAGNDLDVVSWVGGAEVRQLPTQDRTASQSARYMKARRQDGPGDPELGLHEDPRRTSHRVEDRNRTDDGGGHVGGERNRAGARAGEEANVEAVSEDALGYAVRL